YLKPPVGQEERLGIVVSDAASKGLPAAIQALFVSGAIRMGIGFSTRISNLINRLNTLIYDTFPSERFVTLFYCELTLSSNRLVLYANAGHCTPIHYCPTCDSFEYLPATGGLLGLMQNQKIEVENMTMKPGDILIIYTDGITEARNSNNEFFGEERIAEVIRKYHAETPKMIAYNLLEEVQKFSANSTVNDDKTIVVIKRDEK
nr:PP2C family protein-serine/threonine phosphatase [Candidatus Kapabacteria bacterium]